jgi:tRNA(Ile)-lysidine synthase
VLLIAAIMAMAFTTMLSLSSVPPVSKPLISSSSCGAHSKLRVFPEACLRFSNQEETQQQQEEEEVQGLKKHFIWSRYLLPSTITRARENGLRAREPLTRGSSSDSSSRSRNCCLEEGSRSKVMRRRLARKLSRTVRERHLLQPGQRILLAVSGGQDSVSLLHLMATLGVEWNWSLGVVHCDHQWSPAASRAQASHVSQLAASLKMDYYQAVTTSPVPAEELARTWRYGVLQRIALRHKYSAIVTAHTASDRVETLLYNLFRGSGLHGLQSLTWKRFITGSLALSFHSAFNPDRLVHFLLGPDKGRVEVQKTETALVRPFLGFTRTELREFCDILELPLWPDPSNHSLKIDRNRIRHQLLPYLRQNFQGSVDKSLARCAEIVHAEQAYLDSLCESILKKAEACDESGKMLDLGILQSLPLALQRRVIKQFVESLTGRSLGFDHIERVRAAVCSEENRDNGCLELPGGASLSLFRTHLHLSIRKSSRKS